MNDAQFFMERKGYEKAISILEPDFQINPTQRKAIALGEAFFNLRKYETSLSYYEAGLSLGAFKEQDLIAYFEALYQFEDYTLARSVAQEISSKFGNKSFINKMDSAQKLKEIDPLYVATRLTMNSKANEYGFYSIDGVNKIVNSDFKPNAADQRHLKNFLNPYLVSVNDTSNPNPKYIPLVIEDGKFHDVVSHFDPVTRTVYLTLSNARKHNLKPNENNLSTLQIFYTTLDSNLKIGTLVPFIYNSENYSVAHPTVSKNGDMIYFASDKPGGFGGTDLYRCMKLNDGTWGYPINLGPRINTPGNETFPYISPQGNTLYFSSTGHSIFGGLDINKANKSRSHSFERPVNLGVPINSNKDDFAVSFSDNYGGEGFFSSNRENGGEEGDDIYHFSYVNNRVCTDPIKNFTIHVLDKKTHFPIKNVNLKMTIRSSKEILKGATDEYGDLHLTVKGCTDFDVEATHDLYLNNEFYYDGFKKSVTVFLDKKELENVMRLENVYYELDKYEVPISAKDQLERLAILLKKNEDVTVELSSHTDSRGKDEYNLTLSQKRAEHIVQRLISLGVKKQQLKAKGYGESKLVNVCSDEVPCDEFLHEKNRRTEFKIIAIRK